MSLVLNPITGQFDVTTPPVDLASPGAIGGTTPGPGAFTTLSASGAVSGAGFTARFAAPGPIGDVTPGPVNATSALFGASGGSKLNLLRFGNTLQLASDVTLSWADFTTTENTTSDLKLVRAAANTLAQRNGTNAQTFQVVNTYTDGSNFETGVVGWNNNTLFVGTDKAGTGTARSLSFLIGGTGVWTIQGSTGHLLAATDNTYDIGASGATRPRNVYVAGGVTSTSVNATSHIDFGAVGNVRLFSPAANVLRISDSGGTDFDRLQFGGTTASFPALKRSGTTLQVRLADDSAFSFVEDLYRRAGTGTPEAAVTAPVGAVFHRTDGGAGTSFYVKESGTGNTGWVAK